MSKLVVVRGEFKGTKMIYIYKNQEDADKAAAGERVFPAFSCGIKKAQHIINHISDIYEFVVDEGEIAADFGQEEFQRLVQLVEADE